MGGKTIRRIVRRIGRDVFAFVLLQSAPRSTSLVSAVLFASNESTMNQDQNSDSQSLFHQTVEMGTIRDDEISGPIDTRHLKRGFLSVIRSKADIGVHAFVHARTILGRNPNCTFPLHDFRVSWQHAAITPTGENEFVLEDLQSTNGTRVNGTPVVGGRVMQDGDKIFIGETVLRFSLADKIDIDFHSEVETLVGTDPLTGLPSKRRFDEALEFAIQAAMRTNESLAVLMMDMDGVKTINDTHGHMFGAHVIGETGRLISKAIGAKGRACRFGGDEFSAFMLGHDLDAACAVSEEIRVAVETAGMSKDGIELKPTISIGVACYPRVGRDLLSLITIADEALYRAKAQGKNCVAT
jgi:two-component system, cell cycle response regulator